MMQRKDRSTLLKNSFSRRPRGRSKKLFVGTLLIFLTTMDLYALFSAYNLTPHPALLDGIFVGSQVMAGIETITNSNPHVVAYAVSFIMCGNFESSTAGLVDASLILRHSIHKISSRNPSSGSKYNYKMYAIVHRQAEKCSAILKDVGFEIVVVDPPIQPSEIKGEYLRKKIHRNGCCGHHEFIKLQAYTLPHEIVVHVDIDFAFFKPMDNLFDAMLYDKNSEEGRNARSLIELERPGERLPDKIGAFITRDWSQVAPTKFLPGYQAGFLVARHDPKVMPEMLEIVREGNFTYGWGRGSGWHGSGHGGYWGDMGVQGLVAYYYDHVNTDNAVELNQCRYNHMGLDILYRGPPNYFPRRVKKEYLGGCRNGLKYCEDCMNTEFDKIYSVHYAGGCKKPWLCISRSDKDSINGILSYMVNPAHCHELHRHWHDLRVDFENQLFRLTKDKTILEAQSNEYNKDIFRGHCSGEGNAAYTVMSGKVESFMRVPELYD